MRHKLALQAIKFKELTYGVYPDASALTESGVADLNAVLRSLPRQARKKMRVSDPVRFIALATWARDGFPMIRYKDQKFAAALMATTPPETLEFKLPYETFLVSVPRGLLYIDGTGGAKDDIATALVSQVYRDGEIALSVLGIAESGFTLFTINSSPSRLLEVARDFDKTYEIDDPTNLDRTESDRRTNSILLRLIINTCSVVTEEPGFCNRSVVDLGHTTRSPRPILGVDYVLGSPITLDCRESIREYLRGNGTSPSVRFLVRGYWRNQTHGPQNSLRRRQWIRPAWHGPLRAPVLVRPIDLAGP